MSDVVLMDTKTTVNSVAKGGVSCVKETTVEHYTVL